VIRTLPYAAAAIAGALVLALVLVVTGVIAARTLGEIERVFGL
jgi:hypothetical protein